jgi:DNA repair exonuclease SbcCD ATPase subunit
MWIKNLTVRNWMAFKGETTLDLGPKAYAVSAQLDDDPTRSNFLGKSALVESVLFALTGWLNPSRRFDNADGWITRGEPLGMVRLTLDDGRVVERSRKVGKSTQLSFANAKQDQAQLLIDQALGLTESDLLATSFCVQRECAFLVRAAGADLDEVFGSWLQLGKLERAQDRLAKAAAAAGDQVEALAREDERLSLQEQGTTKAEPVDEGALQGLLTDVAALETRVRVARAQHGAKAKLTEYEQLVAEGVRLRGEYDAMGHDQRLAHQEAAQEAERRAHSERDKLRAEHQRAAALAAGEFDGQCPVGKMPCPVSADLVASRARNKKLASAALTALGEAERAATAASTNALSARAKVQEVERLAERLQSMRERAEKLYEQVDPEAPEPEDLDALEAELRAARDKSNELKTAAAVRVAAISQVVHLQQLRAQLTPKLAAAKQRAALLGAAALVLRHTRRNVTREALAEIQDAANDDLADLGVPLTVLLRWEREGRGLATECDSCGRPYPESARVKACDCGVARGPKMVSRLDCQLSDRSGGAEDLAGVIVQLAAGRWLREERASAWAVCALDEVTAALDASMRRALTQHLPRMLEQAGYRQAFVVSHSPQVAEALPGKIVVTSSGGFSTAKVVA